MQFYVTAPPSAEDLHEAAQDRTGQAKEGNEHFQGIVATLIRQCESGVASNHRGIGKMLTFLPQRWVQHEEHTMQAGQGYQASIGYR